jgi:hypothetical protein
MLSLPIILPPAQRTTGFGRRLGFARDALERWLLPTRRSKIRSDGSITSKAGSRRPIRSSQKLRRLFLNIRSFVITTRWLLLRSGSRKEALSELKRPCHSRAVSRKRIVRRRWWRRTRSKSSRMLKKSASFVLASFSSSTYGHGKEACLGRLGVDGRNDVASPPGHGRLTERPF